MLTNNKCHTLLIGKCNYGIPGESCYSCLEYVEVVDEKNEEIDFADSPYSKYLGREEA